MKEPFWLEQYEVFAIHAELLARFGGLDRVRYEGMLRAALARARNRFAYDEPAPDLPVLAAAYADGIVGTR